MTDLLIFDCDGVLVDSEPIAERVLAQAATKLGWPVSAEEAPRAFPKGGTLAGCVATIEARIGRPVPAGFEATYRAQLYRTLIEEAQPIPGVVDAIERLTVPYCVASNAPLKKIETSLRTLGLFERFEGRMFSAYALQRFKPLPDVFLHAAATLGADPARCVVVEDSLAGITAARAAGMRVFGYSRRPAEQAAFREAGAEPLADMAELPERIR